MRLLIIVLVLFAAAPTYGQLQNIPNIINEIDSQEELNGLVLVGKDGEVIFQKAFGMANHSLDIENNLDTKFLIGSLTKQFTAVLILQQLEAGQLNLDVPISAYLPDFRKQTGDQITIRHLLTHTHGIPNASLNDRFKPMDKEVFIKKYCETDLEFEPGTRFEYSDIVGYYILGAILEEITNDDFPSLLDKMILQPLDMRNTGYYSPDINQLNLAIGYFKKEDSFSMAAKWDISQSFSAAGMYSTVGDLFKWDQALRGTQLISNESLNAIFTPYKEEIRYGFGWFINDPEINGKKRLFAGHNGGANGYKAQIMRGIIENLVVIYLSNTDKYVELRYPVIEALMIAEE